MQPALSMGDERDRILCAAHDETRIFNRLDQRLNLGLVGQQDVDSPRGFYNNA